MGSNLCKLLNLMGANWKLQNFMGAMAPLAPMLTQLLYKQPALANLPQKYRERKKRRKTHTINSYDTPSWHLSPRLKRVTCHTVDNSTPPIFKLPSFTYNKAAYKGGCWVYGEYYASMHQTYIHVLTFINKTKDWALVQNTALVDVEVSLG